MRGPFPENSPFLDDVSRLRRFREMHAVRWLAAMDYGYTHYSVVLLGCFDHLDNLYIVDEHAERHWIPQRHAHAIKEMLARHRVYCSETHAKEAVLAQYPQPNLAQHQIWNQARKRIIPSIITGSDMFGTESNGNSLAAQYRDLGISIRPANMDRVGGWSSVLQRLGDPAAGVMPSVFIHKRCKLLLERLPYLQHDPDRHGDIMKTNTNEEGAGGDDAADALRYLVATKPNIIHVRKLRGFY